MIYNGRTRNIVPDNERVARFVFSPSMIEEDQLAPCAFELAPQLPSGKPEDYLSLSRMALCGPITRDSFPYQPRVKGDSFCGYAHIEVSSIHNYNEQETTGHVLEWPTKKNSAHAGLIYQVNNSFVVGECHEPGYILITAYLAAEAKLELF